MTTLTDKDLKAPKSNVQNNKELTTEQFQLIDDEDDELLSSYISNMEETSYKSTSSVTDIGEIGQNTSNSTGNVFKNSASSSTSCDMKDNSGSTIPLKGRDNKDLTTSIVHSNDLKDTVISLQVSTNPTNLDDSRVGPAGDTASSQVTIQTDTACSGSVTRTDQIIVDQTDKSTPLEMFRPGYLWVSDITRQHWCEQQLLYSFTVPGILVEDPVMTKGSDLHLQRELAVHDVVKINITSSEDVWAVKMLNLLNSVQAFLHGSPLAREVPIFGAPFNEDVFVVGLIDELRFDLETYAIGLSELKTRLSKTKPSKSQEKQHRLQVMLYKKLFDDLVKGNVTKDVISRHLRLKLTKEVGESVQEELNKSGLSCKTLDTLLDMVFGRMAAVTCIGETSVEYVHQESGQSFLHQDIVYDEEELKNMYHHYLGFWRGERAVQGVDIEDAWKCQRCDYESVCEWRQTKAAECVRKNKLGKR
ncbi:exonuclease V-like [Pecten maximus]|uniref:exonuclease V-like n=1 Tax=Pecten maximus TaxID=6579 RepID=UPI0014581732|nr:exonuclease V-like [Pecten maximus]